MVPDNTDLAPEGNHTHYVVDAIQVPTTSAQAHDFGLDLNGDGAVDNQLGMVLGALAGQGIDVQASVDQSVADGTIIQLADVQTTDFASAPGKVALYLGTMPSTSPCSDANDQTCGHHLDGMTTFSVDASSPHDPQLEGTFDGGNLTAGPGHLTLAMALGKKSLLIPLVGARAVLTAVTPSTIDSAIFAGAVTHADLTQRVLPAIHDGLIEPILSRDCKDSGPPGCSCADGSSGKQLIGLFDTAPADCAISLDEITHSALLANLLAPDVTLEGKPALSLGVRATAVGGTFPQQ